MRPKYGLLAAIYRWYRYSTSFLCVTLHAQNRKKITASANRCSTPESALGRIVCRFRQTGAATGKRSLQSTRSRASKAWAAHSVYVVALGARANPHTAARALSVRQSDVMRQCHAAIADSLAQICSVT